MSRLIVALLLVSLLSPAAALGQEAGAAAPASGADTTTATPAASRSKKKKTTKKKATAQSPAASSARPAAAASSDSPAPSAAGSAAAPLAAPAPAARPVAPLTPGELDPAVRDLVRREVEKAKAEVREELRAEAQGAQSAAEFMGTASVGERTKLEFLQLNGYFRTRFDLFDNLDLHRTADPSGYFLYPRPLRDSDNRGTLTSSNLRLRLEPTVNVSEHVRVLAQVDALDNIVLGSTAQGVFARSDGILFPFDARGQTPATAGVNSDRNSITVKRAWGEVQTPLGLLSFGRMPSSWGLGILANSGSGIDDDFGDSVDRVQFAVTPLSTPVGKLVFIPMYEMVVSGVTSQDQRIATGLGQPFDRDPADDCKAFGLKILRMDTDDEMKRKWDRGHGSMSYGAWYMYKTQGWEFPTWLAGGSPPITGSDTTTTPPSTGQSNPDANDQVGSAVRRDANAHTADLWWRYQSRRFRAEIELAGIIGQIGNGSPAAPGRILIRQWGGTAQLAWKLLKNRLSLGAEVGAASGDRSPGFGNRPARNCSGTGASFACATTAAGDIDGAQFSPADRVMDVRNFRFNPAYRVDLILFREILGGVTDAVYIKPTARFEILDGLEAHAAIIYSQAMYAASTPSTVHTPLGFEFDLGASYRTDDGFTAFLDYGLLQPLSGLGYVPGQAPASRDMTRGHAVRAGLAIKF